MELFLYELKKIWHPAILVAIALLGVIYYFLFPEFYVQYFNNGDSAQASFSISADWSRKYGPTIEPEERAELDARLAEEESLFSERLTAFDEAREYGFSDWDSFYAFQQAYYEQTSENSGKAGMETERVIWKVIGGTNYFTIQTLMRIMDTYDNLAEDIPPNLNYNGIDDSTTAYDKIMARVKAIKASDMVHGYLPSGMLESTNNYMKHLTIWSILSLVLLLSPTLVRDQIRRLHATQWSSKKGRRILNTQFAAAEFSALALTLINLIVYAIPFLMQHPLIFRNFQLFSFQIFWIPWFDWTYGQYLILMALMVVVVAVATGELTVFLSQYSRNYVAMLLKALPLFAVLAYFSSNWLVNHLFFTRNKLSKMLALPGAECFGAGLIVILGIGLHIFTYRKQLHRDL